MSDAAVWWSAVRPRLVALSAAPPPAAAALESALRLAAAPHPVGQPDDFRAYLDVVGPTLWIGHRIALDFMVLPAATILAAFGGELTTERDEGEPGIGGAGAWLEFAQRGD